MSMSLWVAIGGLITAISTLLFKVHQARKIEKTTEYKGVVGTSELVECLYDIKEKTGAKIVSLGSVSNGGGQIRAGMPLFMKLHHSTDQPTLELYCEPAMLSSDIVKYYTDMLKNNDTCFDADILSAKLAAQWVLANNIKNVCMFLVGIDIGERIFILFINFEKGTEMSSDNYLYVVKKVLQLNKIIHFKKKWYQIRVRAIMD